MARRGSRQPAAAGTAAAVNEVISSRSVGAAGLPPKYAVPDFIALTNDAETVAAAKTIGQVLWDDLNFEREFYLIPRDTYRTIPPATSIEQVPLDQWKQLGADGLVIGTVQKTAGGVAVQVRLIEVASGRTALAKEYSGTPEEPAAVRAHGIATKFTSSSGRCAASRGRSSRSPRIATASG